MQGKCTKKDCIGENRLGRLETEIQYLKVSFDQFYQYAGKI